MAVYYKDLQITHLYAFSVENNCIEDILEKCKDPSAARYYLVPNLDTFLGTLGFLCDYLDAVLHIQKVISGNFLPVGVIIRMEDGSTLEWNDEVFSHVTGD